MSRRLAAEPPSAAPPRAPALRRGPRLADLPPSSRPREKLLSRGAGSLTHAELLALLLGGGTRAENVVALAVRLLRRHGLDGLSRLGPSAWQCAAGVGPARTARILAALELGRRVSDRDREEPAKVTTPAAAWRAVHDLGRHRRERLVGLYLDGQNRLLARETLSVGSLNTTRTHPREILEPALRHLALGFILAHNHPGGSLEPSSEDLAFTRAVARAAVLMDIGFYDHLVVARGGFTSLRERGLMPDEGAW